MPAGKGKGEGASVGTRVGRRGGFFPPPPTLHLDPILPVPGDREKIWVTEQLRSWGAESTKVHIEPTRLVSRFPSQKDKRWLEESHQGPGSGLRLFLSSLSLAPVLSKLNTHHYD